MGLHVLQCPVCYEFSTIDEKDWRILCRPCYDKAKLKKAEDEIKWLRAVVKRQKEGKADDL